MVIGVLLMLGHGSGILFRLNCDNVTLKQFKQYLKNFFWLWNPGFL